MTSINTIRVVMADRPEFEQLAAHARIREIEVADTEGIVALPGAVEAFRILDGWVCPTRSSPRVSGSWPGSGSRRRVCRDPPPS